MPRSLARVVPLASLGELLVVSILSEALVQSDVSGVVARTGHIVLTRAGTGVREVLNRLRGVVCGVHFIWRKKLLSFKQTFRG